MYSLCLLGLRHLGTHKLSFCVKQLLQRLVCFSVVQK
jgi:hypothetical protein